MKGAERARRGGKKRGGGGGNRGRSQSASSSEFGFAPSSLDERLGVSAQIPALPDRERFMTDVGWSVFVAPSGSVAVVGLVPQTPDSPRRGTPSSLARRAKEHFPGWEEASSDPYAHQGSPGVRVVRRPVAMPDGVDGVGAMEEHVVYGSGTPDYISQHLSPPPRYEGGNNSDGFPASPREASILDSTSSDGTGFRSCRIQPWGSEGLVAT